MRKGGVLALGNFDGLHLGHRRVIETTVALAFDKTCPAQVLTFAPHPRAFFNPSLPPFRLTPEPDKDRLLKACGIDDILTLPFTRALAELEAESFVQDILLDRLGVRHVVAGEESVFGCARSGDMKKLAAWLAPHKIDVTAVPPVTCADGQILSSSRIRSFLEAGQPRDAAQILGRDWSISGPVIRGAARGRTLGVPTANIALGDYLRPRFGVYAIKAGRLGEGLSYTGVANIGLRPTFGESEPNLEAHLFDFAHDIYGESWEIALIDFIRPEQTFPDLNALRAQIIQDQKTAREVLQV